VFLVTLNYIQNVVLMIPYRRVYAESKLSMGVPYQASQPAEFLRKFTAGVGWRLENVASDRET
jgi:hypothetical protein